MNCVSTPRNFAVRLDAFLGAAMSIAALLGCQSDPAPAALPASSRCATCHLSDFEATTHPPHDGVRPKTCGVCHSEDAWHPVRTRHSWPLIGAHANADCSACHKGTSPQFEGTSKVCLDCHKTAKDKADQSTLHHGTFPTTCETCHTTAAWKPTLPHPSPSGQTGVSGAALTGQTSVKTHHTNAQIPTVTHQASGKPQPKPAQPVVLPAAPSLPRPTDVVSGASHTGRK